MLTGKRVIVFGAGGRIGVETVKKISELGANVIGVDINFPDGFLKEQEIQRLHSSVVLEKLDVCAEQDMEDFFDGQVQIDGVVNCSYPKGNNFGREFIDVNIDDFCHTLKLHLGSAIHITQLCVRFFEKNKQPLSLVNFSSIYGSVAPKFEIYEGQSMTTPIEYSLMKAALQHLNKYISSYVQNSKFRINTVAPGGIFDNHSDKFRESYAQHTRGTGMLDAADVVGTVAFLLSDNSKYVTGQNFLVDDGFSI